MIGEAPPHFGLVISWALMMFGSSGYAVRNVLDATKDLSAVRRAVAAGMASRTGARYHWNVGQARVQMLVAAALILFGVGGILALVQGGKVLDVLAVWSIFGGGLAVALVAPIGHRTRRRVEAEYAAKELEEIETAEEIQEDRKPEPDREVQEEESK